MKTSVPDVGASVAVTSAPHRDLQTVPPGEIDRNGHVLRGGGDHDDARLEIVPDCQTFLSWLELTREMQALLLTVLRASYLGPQQVTTWPITSSWRRDTGAW